MRRAARGINSCLPAAVTSLDLPLDSRGRVSFSSNELELISDRVLHPRPKTAYLSHFLARFQEDTLPVKSTVSVPQNKGRTCGLGQNVDTCESIQSRALHRESGPKSFGFDTQSEHQSVYLKSGTKVGSRTVVGLGGRVER